MALYRTNKPRDPQAKFHVKKNDEVVVLSGTQQGKRGKILQVLRDRHRVIVEGVNFIKKASRKSQEQPQGGIVEREGALHISKIMLATDYDNRKGASKPAAAAPEAEASAAKPARKSAAKGKK
jgi:large subunit ribosomal protein L24